MKDIPSDVAQWFAQQRVDHYSLVEHNPRKGRWCFTYLDKKGNKVFYKWNENKDEYSDYYSSLKYEEQIYQNLQTTDILPHYIGGGQFVTECVSTPMTLRQYIKSLNTRVDEDSIFICVSQTIIKWQKYIEYNLDFLKRGNTISEYKKYLYSTMVACPMDAVQNKLEKIINGYLLFIISRLLQRKVEKILNKEPQVFKAIHGDFHLNNVLRDGDGRLYLVDFEDAKKCLPELELAYFMSQVHLLLRKNRSLINRIDQFVENNVFVFTDRTLYCKMLKIFDFTIRFNHAFV